MFTEEERAKWRELVARWKAGEKVFNAGKRIEKTDATTVQRQEPIQPIKRQYGKVVDPKLIERKQQQQLVIKQGKNYTQRRVEEESKPTWRTTAADIAHGAGEGAMFVSNFIPFAGEFFAGSRALLNNAKSYLTHPFYKTVYHGSPYPFDIKNAWTATNYDIGLHVGENPAIANTMKHGSNGVVYKLRIPPADTQAIDIGANGVEHFDRARKFTATRPFRNDGAFEYYDTTPGDEYRISLLKNAGGDPVVDGNRLYLNNDATVNLLDNEFPGLSQNARNKAIKLNNLQKGNTINDQYNYQYVDNLDFRGRLNKEAADLLSENGYKVIKYNNANPYEGGGGASYMITDPSVIDVIKPIPDRLHVPFIGAGSGSIGSRIYNKYAE